MKAALNVVKNNFQLFFEADDELEDTSDAMSSIRDYLDRSTASSNSDIIIESTLSGDGENFQTDKPRDLVAVIGSHEGPYVTNVVETALQLQRYFDVDMVWTDRAPSETGLTIDEFIESDERYTGFEKPRQILGTLSTNEPDVIAAMKSILVPIYSRYYREQFNKHEKPSPPIRLSFINCVENLVPNSLLRTCPERA